MVCKEIQNRMYITVCYILFQNVERLFYIFQFCQKLILINVAHCSKSVVYCHQVMLCIVIKWNTNRMEKDFPWPLKTVDFDAPVFHFVSLTLKFIISFSTKKWSSDPLLWQFPGKTLVKWPTMHLFVNIGCIRLHFYK